MLATSLHRFHRAAGGVALLALSSAPALAQPAPNARCDGAAAAKSVGVSTRDWQVACLQVDDTRQMVAAVPLLPIPSVLPAKITGPKDGGTTAGPDPASARSDAKNLSVRVALLKDGAVTWRDDVRPAVGAGSDLREVLAKSDEWLVNVDSQPLGNATGARVSVVGHWGTQLMSVREIALLFRVPTDGKPKLVWSGLGNTRESHYEYCLVEGIATFKQVDDHTLERELRVTPTINREVKVSKSRAKALEKKCVQAPPQPAQRFPLNP